MKIIPSRSARPTAGFTLIELLTVIAIIGILAAIIIPTVSKVRDTAKQANCVSNLRNWGVAIHGYAADNKGNYWISLDNGFGPWTVEGQNADDPANVAFNRYMAYFKTKRTMEDYLRCPSIDFETFRALGPNTPDRTNYAIIRGTFRGVPAPLGAVPIAKATQPSRTLLMIERHATPPLNDQNTATGTAASFSVNDLPKMRLNFRSFTRHNKGINSLFMDGHVKRMSWDNGDAGVSLVSAPNGSGTGTLDPQWLRIDK